MRLEFQKTSQPEMLPLPHFSNTSANPGGNINVRPYVHPLRNRRGRRRRQRFVYDPYMTCLAWAKNALLGILRLAETPYETRGNHPEASIGNSSIAHQEQDSAFGECICVGLSVVPPGRHIHTYPCVLRKSWNS